jgi:hypothetical protein
VETVSARVERECVIVFLQWQSTNMWRFGVVSASNPILGPQRLWLSAIATKGGEIVTAPAACRRRFHGLVTKDPGATIRLPKSGLGHFAASFSGIIVIQGRRGRSASANRERLRQHRAVCRPPGAVVFPISDKFAPLGAHRLPKAENWQPARWRRNEAESARKLQSSRAHDKRWPLSRLDSASVVTRSGAEGDIGGNGNSSS